MLGISIFLPTGDADTDVFAFYIKYVLTFVFHYTEPIADSFTNAIPARNSRRKRKP
jgi:hypothetical protein